jgi:hypothetical protein
VIGAGVVGLFQHYVSKRGQQMKNYYNIAQKLGFGLFAIVLLNILAGIFVGKIFLSFFTTFWVFTIGLALVIYPAVLKNRNTD